MAAVEKANAARTRRSNTQHDEADELPPAYQDSIAQTPIPVERPSNYGRLIPGVPNIQFAAYAPVDARLSTDLGTRTIVDATLCKSTQAFAKLLAEQIAIPPIPEIRIRGTHRGWSGDEVDFDIRLNMMRYFLPKDGSTNPSYTKLISAGRKKSRLVDAPLDTDGVEQWAKEFCKSSSQDKIFVITRKVTNWDQEYILGRLHGLLQSCAYKGTPEITFPLYHHTILVKPSSSFSSSLRSAFIGSERYELEVCWPYASHLPGEDSDDESRSSRRCLVRSEMGWFKDWRGTLRAAVLGRRRGWVGEGDWIENAMRVPVVEGGIMPWGEHRR